METKEKLLRQYLVKFAEDQQAEWLKALEFTIGFKDFNDFCFAMLVGRKVILNSDYEADELFSSLVHELWHLRQKEKSVIRYYLFKMFWFRHKIEDSAEEWEAIAEDWIYFNR